MELQKKEPGKKKFVINKKAIAVIVVMLLLAVSGFVAYDKLKPEAKKEIISESTLMEIINVSDLSTYQAIYNGVAEVRNDKGKLKYYVSYDATVKAGFDFSQIDILVDHETKKIEITIPDINITEVDVRIESLDYIFVSKKANTQTVSEEAYKACIDDVTIESQAEAEIFELAEGNAKNVVEALVKPFVDQLDEEYTLEIR